MKFQMNEISNFRDCTFLRIGENTKNIYHCKDKIGKKGTTKNPHKNIYQKLFIKRQQQHKIYKSIVEYNCYWFFWWYLKLKVQTL